MPFNGRRAPEELTLRFSSETIGFEALGLPAWRALLGRLTEYGPERESRLYLDSFDEFQDAVNAEQAAAIAPRVGSRPPECRVFISHQQNDTVWAEQIAFLATGYHFDYWLDVHDPVLALAKAALSPSDPRYGIILAAIIEIGLLNSTHVIAVHSSNSLASKWVPYEFGRAKARRIRSTQAAGWFHPHVSPASFGEYVQLAEICHGGEQGLRAWFKFQRSRPLTPGGVPCRPSQVTWTGPQGEPLPDHSSI